MVIPDNSAAYHEESTLNSTASSEGQQSLTSPVLTSSACVCSWRRRYFVMFPDFDAGGITLFYFVNQLVSASINMLS
jgi:hypothetical protein